jgi:peptidoglycan hydrolase-like protein with peptidoglycan-binding domain
MSLTGVVSLGSRIDVTPLAGADAGRLVVTQARRSAGDVIAPGSALVDVSGRPIIALDLRFPLYRSLHPGDSGPDVAAVQNSLKLLGLYPANADGIFSAGTSTALNRLYIKAGTTPPVPDASLTDAAQNADKALVDARSAVATAGATPAGQATPDLAALTKARDAAHVAAGTWLPLAEIQDVPAGGAHVVSIQPEGTLLTGDSAVVAVLRTGSASVSARVLVGEADTFPQGGPAVVALTADTTKRGQGTVASVSGFRQADPAVTGSMPGYDVQFALDSAAASVFSDGDAVLVNPTSAGTATTGLAVPLIALREDSAGTYVLVIAAPATSGGTDRSTRVDVSAGVQQDGFVLVHGTHLTAGQRVAVGGSN